MATATAKKPKQQVEEPVEEPQAPEAEAPEEEAPEASDLAAKPISGMFRYSTWVHVGPGAHECTGIDEDKGTVECELEEHFHAWVRLPNQFQHREVRDKAMAARARRIRQLRDPETDSYAVLEGDLDELARQGDSAKEGIVEELAGKDWFHDTTQAAKDLAEKEDEHGELIYEHIERDQLRLREINDMPEEERPEEEMAELLRHVEAYGDDLEKATDERYQPRKEALMALELNALIDQMRDQKIEADAERAFLDTYNTWEWFVCTLKGVPKAAGKAPGERRFSSIEAMKGSAPEVVVGIEFAFEELTLDARRASAGN